MRHHVRLPLILSLLSITQLIASVARAEVAEPEDPSDRAARSGPPSDAGQVETLPDRPALAAPTPPVAPRPPAAPPEQGAQVPPSAPPAPRAPSADPTPSEVMAVVRGLRGLSTWTVIPLAHFRRGDRHVVVAWPALNAAGQLVDATVVGICLQPASGGGLEECGRRWVVRDRAASQASLVQALGGQDYDVVGRHAGTPLSQLGPRLGELGSAFSEAVSRGDRDGVRRAATAFSELLPVERAALENGVAQLLWAAAHHEGRLQHVDTLQQGDGAVLTFHVMRGRHRFRTIRAHARRVDGQVDRWIVVDYQ